MIKTYERLIDTNADGLVIQLPHALGGEPFIQLSEPTTMGDYKIVSLYDPRIAQIETKGMDILQISFVSPFIGKVKLSLPIANYVSVEDQIKNIDRRLNDLTVQQRQLVAKKQWSEMNSYLDNKSVSIEEDIAKLQSDIINVRNDIESL